MTTSSKVAQQYQAVNFERFYTKSFAMCVINKGGTIPHYDYKDEPEGYCCVVPLGDFKGGDLVFREHCIRLAIKSGDLVFFHSCYLLHENLAFSGIRYSLVFTTHHNMITEFGQSVLEDRIKKYKVFGQNPIDSHNKLRLLSDEDLEDLWQKCQFEPWDPITQEEAKENRKKIAEKNEEASLIAVNHQELSHRRHGVDLCKKN